MTAIRNVLILGGGSAGCLAGIALKRRLPQLGVTLLRSKDIGIIGVGEGTTMLFPKVVHEYCGIPIGEFYEMARPQWKLGIRFVSWGPQPFFDYTFEHQLDLLYGGTSRSAGYYFGEGPTDYCGPISGLMSHNAVFWNNPDGSVTLPQGLAYHLENEKLVGCFEQVLARSGVVVEDDTVVEVMQDGRGVSGLRLASGRTMQADLYVDSSGFRSVLLGQALGEPFESYKSTLLCDRAVVGGWAREEEPIKPYTTAEGMDAGWCWQIEHEERINRGYVYCPEFLSDSDAEAEFRRKNPKVKSTRVVKFRAGRYQRNWVKNVVAVGNAAGFVEPLEATALGVICSQSSHLTQTLIESDLRAPEAMVRLYNTRQKRDGDQIRWFLGVHYKYNTRQTTPFWQACREKVDIGAAQELVDYYQSVGPGLLYATVALTPDDLFKVEGYLAMLVGQRVPYHPAPLPASDWVAWREIQEQHRRRSMSALTVPQALKLVRSPGWKWPAETYQKRVMVRV